MVNSHPDALQCLDAMRASGNGVDGLDAANGDSATDESNFAATESELPERHPLTGIDVLIVGAGMGGLTSALECWRKGHNVVGILERSKGPVYTGHSAPFQVVFTTNISSRGHHCHTTLCRLCFSTLARYHARSRSGAGERWRIV